MTTEEIIRMAQQYGDWNGETAEFNNVGLTLFTASVVQNHMAKACGDCVVKKCYKRMDAEIEAAVLAEREACAKSVYDSTDWAHEERDMVLKEAIAAAIRAMGCKLSSTVEENTK